MRLGGCEELGATNDYDLAHLRTHVVRETTIASFVLVSVASGSWMHPRPSSRPPPPQEPVWRFYFPRKRGMTVTSAKAIGTMSGARNVDVGQGRAAAALEVTFLFLGREASLILIQTSSGGRRARQTSRGGRSPWVLGASSALGATEGSAEWSPPAVTP